MEQVNTTLTTKKSTVWLWLILLITLGLTAWTMFSQDTDDEGNSIKLVAPEAHQTKQVRLNNPQRGAMKTAGIDWMSVKNRVTSKTPPEDLFAVHSWQVAMRRAPEKIRVLPPPEPVAPPAPFAYAGKLENVPEGTLVFLTGGNKVYSVPSGAAIDAVWRLDSEDTNYLYLTYLPLNLPQKLSKNQNAVAPVLDYGTSQRFNSSNADE